MFTLLLYLRKMRLRKQKGFALMESLLLIIIVAFTVAAILQSAYLSTTLQTAGRRYVESHKSMVSFFHTLESVEADDIMSENIFDLVRSIDTVGSYVNILTSSVDTYDDGVVRVKITLADSERSRKEIIKTYNRFSNRTVSDDRYKVRNKS
jgi:Tfp pilus assembly protein PilV